MTTASNLPSANRFVPARVLCGVSLALCVVSLVAITGCPSKGGAKSSVHGFVKLDGQPVSGIVTFIGPDNKEVVGPIRPDGTYSVDNPVPGQNKIIVKSMLPTGGLKAPPKDTGPPMPTIGGDSKGVPPPEKYGSATTTPLTFDVKGTGKQEFNITLSQ